MRKSKEWSGKRKREEKEGSIYWVGVKEGRLKGMEGRRKEELEA